MNKMTTAALFALLGVLPMTASTIAYTDASNQGTQSFNGNLALLFDVLTPISVTELGVFNAPGTGVIGGTIQVVIYDLGTHTQVTPVVTFHGNYAAGFDVFQSIAPVYLTVGSYEIDAVGYGTDLNGNLNTGSSSGPILDSAGGAIAFAGAAYDSSTVLDGPTGCAGCQPLPQQQQQFDAGTFAFVAAPEPSTIGLMGFGLLGMTAILRRKAASAKAALKIAHVQPR